ncbi:MAG: hypothetical protein HC934_12875 [Acaryochloridaceae cyanobacterium SU_2_1]|nr:hypothetical protein [Acaryochloridaceae cyanobacterium SU_2_1]
MEPASLKKQILWVAVGCILLTLAFGGLLSLAVNRSLAELDRQQEIQILPAPEAAPNQPL